MKLARYMGGGQIAILDEPMPSCPPGGLLIRTEASGLCSGELMDWYMEKKIPHVLGHEVAGIVTRSEDERFPVGSRVFPHHHAPCMQCDLCNRGLYVHCAQWKRTKLIPGGMAEFFAVSAENLTDTMRVDDLRAIDAALIEPLACVVKSWTTGGLVANAVTTRSHLVGAVQRNRVKPYKPSCAVIGLGTMGLMHTLLLPGSVGYDLSADRIRHALSLGLDARHPDDSEKADAVFVCPGSKAALDFAIRIANPGATVTLFAPMPPGEQTPVDLNYIYFNEILLVSTYSCGPNDTKYAVEMLRENRIKCEEVVSDFITIDELPEAYQKMKRGEILKPMVVFDKS